MKEKIEYRIVPPSKFSLNISEILEYRELFYFFTWRDIKVRYKQTLLGVLWAVLQPLALMLVFWLLLAKNFQLSTNEIPAPLFYYSGLLLWNFFSSSVLSASNSMVENADMIKKIYFPRLIIPGSAILTAFFDFLVASILFVLIVIYFYTTGLEIAWLRLVCYFPLGVSLVLISATGIGVLISALNVKYRDFRYVIPFVVQFGFFVSPVIFPLDSVELDWLRNILAINPVSGAIHLCQSAFVVSAIDWSIVGISTVSSLVFLGLGTYTFKSMEAYFADIA
jgi:lipopolysaccharide transport system permease protein